MKNTRLIQIITVLGLLVASVPITHAFTDDRQQIAQQWQAHERAVSSALSSFARGNAQGQRDAMTVLATSEAYLAILGVPADDSRLVAWLFDGEQHMPERISRLYHHLLKEKTGFESSLSALLSEAPRYGYAFYQ